MFKNKFKNNNFNPFINESFYFNYIKISIKFNLKVYFCGIKINKYKFRVLNMTYI